MENKKEKKTFTIESILSTKSSIQNLSFNENYNTKTIPMVYKAFKMTEEHLKYNFIHSWSIHHLIPVNPLLIDFQLQKRLYTLRMLSIAGSTKIASRCGYSKGNTKSRYSILRRSVFSDHQRKNLEWVFDKQKYVNKIERKKLADKLGLKDSQVKIWFQNRRMKWRNAKEKLQYGLIN